MASARRRDRPDGIAEASLTGTAPIHSGPSKLTPAEILALFDAERGDPRPEPGVRYDRSGSVIRAVGAWNAVAFARLTAGTADAVIAEQVMFFRSLAPGASQDRTVEWKVYGHDLPPDLGSRLAAAGFEPEEPETLMVFDLGADLRDRGRAADGPGGRAVAVEIPRVIDTQGLADATEAARIAFARDKTWQAERMEQYARRLADPTTGLYVAYADGRPVASARAEFPEGRSFAGLWGGVTIPEYRGRGIYRALVHVRAEEARRRGYRYLRVDARETSRPILERLGFIALTAITEWRLTLPPRPLPDDALAAHPR